MGMILAWRPKPINHLSLSLEITDTKILIIRSDSLCVSILISFVSNFKFPLRTCCCCYSIDFKASAIFKSLSAKKLQWASKLFIDLVLILRLLFTLLCTDFSWQKKKKKVLDLRSIINGELFCLMDFNSNLSFTTFIKNEFYAFLEDLWFSREFIIILIIINQICLPLCKMRSR